MVMEPVSVDALGQLHTLAQTVAGLLQPVLAGVFVHVIADRHIPRTTYCEG